MKICSVCHINKKEFEFSKDKSHCDGLRCCCKKCNSEISIKWRLANPEKVKTNRVKYYKKHGEKVRLKAMKWYETNKEKALISRKVRYEANRGQAAISSKMWIAANPEKRRETARKYSLKIRKTLKGKLSGAISSGINVSLRKGTKAGRHWETLVNFTIDHLKRHLERLFTPEMTWANYGTYWHIDHKIPIAVFNFEKPEHIDFQLCWSLENLQPLQATKNISKGCKLLKPFQPSLAMAVGG